MEEEGVREVDELLQGLGRTIDRVDDLRCAESAVVEVPDRREKGEYWQKDRPERGQELERHLVIGHTGRMSRG